MHVYFVRHGETELNRRFMHQSPETPLSMRGVEQARTVAEYLRAMTPELIFTSDYQRAKETADVIGSILQITPHVDARFREIVRPSSLCGRSLLTPHTFLYVYSSIMKRGDSLWHFEDAENFADVYRRVEEALTFLESLHDTHASVVVVSHTIFINLLVASMCSGRVCSLRDLIPAFFHIREMRNCEVVGIKYLDDITGGGRVCNWQLVHNAR